MLTQFLPNQHLLSDARWWRRFLSLALAYYVAAQLGLSVPLEGAHITLIWMPSGIALAALLRGRLALWPAIWLAAFAVLLPLDGPLVTKLINASGNTLAPVVGVMLLRRWRFESLLLRRRDVALLILIGAVGASVISATVGTSALVIGGLVPPMHFAAAWLSWWIGDAMGVLVAAVPLLTLRRSNWRALCRVRCGTECLLVLLAVLLVASWLFLLPTSVSVPSGLGFTALFLPMMALVWLAMRRGLMPASIGVLVFSLLAAWGTTQGKGPFFAGATEPRVLVDAAPVLFTNLQAALLGLWAYIATLAVIVMLLAALAAELRDSDAQTAGMFRHSRDGMLFTRPDGRIVSANPAALALLKTTEAALRAGGRSRYVDVTDPRLVQLLAQRADTGSARGVLTMVRGDGSHFEAEVSSSRYAASDGTEYAHVILHDATEQRAAAALLAASEQRFRLMANAAPVLIWTTDATGQHDFFNDVWLSFTGCTREQAVTQAWIERLHPDDAAQVKQAFQAAVMQRQGYSLEYRLRRHDGQWRHLLENAVPRFESDQYIGMIGSAIEVSAMKEAEARLAASEARFQGFMNSSPVLGWITDINGRFVYVNDSYCRVLGLVRERVLNQCFQEFFPVDISRQYEENIQRVAASGQSVEGIEPGVRADGSLGQFLVYKFPLPQAHGGVLVGGIAVDVTERKNAEDALRASEARLRLVLQAAQMASWEYDLSNEQLQWSAQMYELYGVPLHEPASFARLLQQVDPEDRNKVRAAQQAIQQGAASMQVEYRIVDAHGQPRWLLDQGCAVTERENQPRFIGICCDVTDRHRAAQALVEAQTALKANQAKTEFLSRISHELRTPLNAVLGFAQLLELDAQLSDNNRQRTRRILVAGEHLLAMINDILDLSRIEAGRLALSMEELDASTVARQVVELLSSLAARAQVRLIDATAHSPKLCVKADRVRLQQVLSNLLSNAIKYNRPGGSVTLSLQQNGHQGAIAVTDTGRGLEPEQLSKLFEPFNRLGAEASGIEGTGIGLTVAKGLIEAMQGHIAVDSQAKVGSRFTVWLPLATPDANQKHFLPARSDGRAVSDAPAAFTARPLTMTNENKTVDFAQDASAPFAPRAGTESSYEVLYAEDNHINVLLVQQTLALLPSIHLRIATSGAETIELARAARPDLLLLDVHLGDMLGLEVKKRLDADEATAGIDCIVLSADAMPSSLQAAQQIGVLDYLTKPIDVRVLLERVTQRLNKHQQQVVS